MIAGEKGLFTIPGEVGKESLTLALAEKWGADVIRDSDGTKLSPEILNSGYGIYSTICLIREDLPFAQANPRFMQQNFLMSRPVVAFDTTTAIPLLAGFSPDQFVVNDFDGVAEFWQVHDRTTGELVSISNWRLADGEVIISNTIPGHTYTVNFLAMRIWEEISMYNHITNGWGDKPHLMALEPRYPEVAEHMLRWLDEWCTDNPATTVVRLTSLFYNFAWFWGSEANLPHVYTDWASYDFTVNPVALREFKEKTGLIITAEDFVNAGRYASTHNPPSDIYRKWMEFTWEFVLELGQKFVEIIHKHGKKAYVFMDDSWVGLEPFSGRFSEFGFDGLIKAVFSGFEARLNAAIDVPVHELRLHPYLFPVNLVGEPTFAPGGEPTRDLIKYWLPIRRALVRARIDRLGLGGYLSLAEPFPEFQDAVAGIAAEHRQIRDLHLAAEAASSSSRKVRVGVLTAWGELRTWSTSGHFHENATLSTMHVLEALSGLDLDVSFHRLDAIAEHGVPAEVDVLINAGPAGTAWSGGLVWTDPRLTAALTTFVAGGGGLIGIEQPSAVTPTPDQPFRLGSFALGEVFGVDQDTGNHRSLHRRKFEVQRGHVILDRAASAADLTPLPGLRLLHDDVQVVAAADGLPTVTAREFGAGRAVYFSGFTLSAASTRLLENAILWAAQRDWPTWYLNNPHTEVAVFPGGSSTSKSGADTLVILNNTTEVQTTDLVRDGVVVETLELAPAEMRTLQPVPKSPTSNVGWAMST
ncbi:MAG: 1,3-beta-galactosyl-N-acetylhexosamine phosphorylase [Promicromonosporaceae bacterium]|nr:1,3-beta-galactosyl-N-acetylhexosamine phosphorylase [Promicromonosporaceae bacterium]